MRPHRIYVVERVAHGRAGLASEPVLHALIYWSDDETGTRARALASELTRQCERWNHDRVNRRAVPESEKFEPDDREMMRLSDTHGITYVARPVVDDITARCTCLDGQKRGLALERAPVAASCVLHAGDPGEVALRDRHRSGLRNHETWLDAHEEQFNRERGPFATRDLLRAAMMRERILEVGEYVEQVDGGHGSRVRRTNGSSANPSWGVVTHVSSETQQANREASRLLTIATRDGVATYAYDQHRIDAETERHRRGGLSSISRAFTFGCSTCGNTGRLDRYADGDGARTCPACRPQCHVACTRAVNHEGECSFWTHELPSDVRVHECGVNRRCVLVADHPGECVLRELGGDSW